MKHKKLFTTLGLLTTGILVGFFTAVQFGWMSESQAEAAKIFAHNKALPTAESYSTDSAIETAENLNTAFMTIAEQANQSVVTIFVDKFIPQREHPFRFSPFEDFFESFSPNQRPDGQEGERRLRGMGSGVIVSEEGYILTNYHVVSDADKIRIMLESGKKVDAEVVGTDAKSDLAVLKTGQDSLKPIKMGDSENLHVGEWVMAIGSPLSQNLAHTITAGIVSAKGRSNLGLADYEDFIQTDAAINRGNSGGALVNLKGELIGINTAIVSQSGGFQGIGFAVPINMVRQVMEALIRDGKVIRGWLGVYIQDIDESIAKAMDLNSTMGAIVAKVTEDGPAHKAGLQSGDVIVAINGTEVKDVTQLRNIVAANRPGTEVSLKVWRDGEEKTVKVELGKLPDDEATPEMKKNFLDKLGFSVQTLDEQLAARLGYDQAIEGVVITRIDQSSAAFGAGLREGDLIKSVNKKRVLTAGQFNEIIQGLDSGETVLVHSERQQRSFFAAFELE